MHRSSRIRKKPTMDNCYAQVEPRKMLATNVFVDFGGGFASGLEINDAQSDALGGPQVFGASQTLTPLTDSVINFGRDFSGDGMVDSIDVEVMVDQMQKQLQRIFDPFDINLQFVESSSLVEIQSTLQSAASNDAYVFVGGVYSGSDPDFGESVIDTGNMEDNLAFVFPAPWLENASDPLHRITWQISRKVAKHAAHTFGLQTVEATTPAKFDILASPGTGAGGGLLRDSSAFTGGYFFTQGVLALQTVNGVSSGVQNSYDAMVMAVGERPDSPFYINERGESNDFNIVQTSPGIVDITTGFRTFTGVDISNGLIVETGVSSVLQDRIFVDARITQSVDIRASKGNLLGMTDAVTDWTFDGHGAGSINGNVTFEGIIDAVTIEFDNTYTIAAGGFARSIDSGAGADTITIQPGLLRMPNLRLGSGDDNVIVNGVAFGGTVSGFDGFDTVTVNTNGTSYRFGSDFGLGFQIVSGIERVIGSPGTSNQFSTSFNRTNVRVEIRGNVASVRRIDNDIEYFELVNFNSFQLSERFKISQIQIYETAYDVSVKAGDKIVVASTDDLQQSNLEGIDHQIVVSGEGDVVISGRQSSTGLDAVIALKEISGLTREPIIHTRFFEAVEIHGSEHADSFLQTSDLIFERRLFGYGGADLFFYGNNSNPMDLSNLGAIQSLDGGGGDDRLLINDRAHDESAGYRISDRFIVPLVDPLKGFGARQSNASAPPVVGIGFTSMRFVSLEGTPQSDFFQVFPSSSTRFIINGGDSDQAINPNFSAGDVITVEGGQQDARRYLVRPGENNGTWYWGNGQTASVIISDIENVGNVKRLAIGTESFGNSKPTVRVYDPVKQRTLFDIEDVYESSFTGGVRVETADINRDGVPDIIAAPGPGRETDIRIFDGRDGSLLTEFQAYDSSYQRGVDLATGFVVDGLGESRPQIVTSTTRGRPLVRVFDWSEVNQTYELQTEFIAFGGAAYDGGASIDVGDMNGDGIEDIVTASGPGRGGQVFVHQANPIRPSGYAIIQSFMIGPQSLRGGIDISVGNVLGNPRLDFIVGQGLTDDPSDPRTGRLRVYDGAMIVGHPNGVLGSQFTFKAFFAQTGIHVDNDDLDLDGFSERIWTAQARVGRDGVVKGISPNRASVIDLVELAGEEFEGGFNIG